MGLLLAAGGACPGFLGFNWGGPGPPGPPDDCLPQGPAPCGPPWDRDGDTISTATEINTTNNTAYGGFYNFNTARWDTNYSQARGVATNGTLYRGMNLTDFWTGYSHYDFCEGGDKDDWGTGHLLRLIEAAGRLWVQRRDAVSNPPDAARMGVGDLSLKLGGPFPGQPGVPNCEQGHEYHQQGVDVDIRYLRKDGQEAPLDICREAEDYDASATMKLINSFILAEVPDDANAPMDSIFVDMDCLGFNPPNRPLIFHATGHQNHFHVRIRDPDGPFN